VIELHLAGASFLCQRRFAQQSAFAVSLETEELISVKRVPALQNCMSLFWLVHWTFMQLFIHWFLSKKLFIHWLADLSKV
jgi:hypothetical protein